MNEKILLILAVVFAFLSITTEKLNRAVIYLGMFGYFISILYLMYKSPNVAIAEAVIGSTLSTVIYLVALRKQKRFKVYVYQDIPYEILDAIEGYCVPEDLVFHYIRFSKDEYKSILNDYGYDLIIDGDDEDIQLITQSSNYKIENLASKLAKDSRFEVNIMLNEMRNANEMGDI
ncbi:putative MnhB-related membrane protein [Natranaerovirga hydrolytica]|uniref:Putative MnhB-related membrane protein n=1 Tax=Natranaerovirga hydrolytica TaxID=680378 RepID=A0A4V2Q1R3_9FIRM|nr:DUF4040 domain-containing protein [Natranaerovirga hydrolytica]TCK98581.1 putative MnhB-related membrane protein [Natranaerovirga hydrolytica]